jgi:hypothetical protein
MKHLGFVCEKPMRMLKRGNRYSPSSVALVAMLTNPIYLGHWMHKDRVVVWDNHPPIVSEELFYKAFNYLSPYTLTGEPNADYAPDLAGFILRRRNSIPRPKRSMRVCSAAIMKADGNPQMWHGEKVLRPTLMSVTIAI